MAIMNVSKVFFGFIITTSLVSLVQSAIPFYMLFKSERLLQNPLNYGHVLKKLSTPIKGGIPASRGQFPSHVSLRYFFHGRDVPYCAGIIINNYHVLTSAICVYVMTPKGSKILPRGAFKPTIKNLRVVGGETAYVPAKRAKAARKVTLIIINPDHESNDFNFAVLQMDKPWDFSSQYVKPVRLPDWKTIPRTSNFSCQVLGYRVKSKRNADPVSLHFIDVTAIMDRDQCNDMLTENMTFRITPRTFCGLPSASSLYRGPCYGDSGAGLYCNGYLYGMVSAQPNTTDSECKMVIVPFGLTGVLTAMTAVLSLLKAIYDFTTGVFANSSVNYIMPNYLYGFDIFTIILNLFGFLLTVYL